MAYLHDHEAYLKRDRRHRCGSYKDRGLLVKFGKTGNTIETLRERISVPPEIEAILSAYAPAHPGEMPIQTGWMP
jgi:hypothetical protein